MNKSRQLLEAARMRNRINNMIEMNDNMNTYFTDVRKRRNEGAGYQVRNLAGSFRGATFGSTCTGNCTVGQ